MSIRVVCPNGHVLQAKDSLAGKVCLCPKCKEKVTVPRPQTTPNVVTESAVLDIIGKPDPSMGTPQPSMENELQATKLKTQKRSTATPKKRCPHCEREISVGHHICPYCRTYIAALGDF
mgnify:CR=1 FL=1